MTMYDKQEIENHVNEFLEQDGINIKEGTNHEETKQEGKPTQTETATENPIEMLAASYGWKAEGKKTAEEYVKFALEQLPERGEALGKQNNEIKELKGMITTLASTMDKQKQKAYNDAKRDLEIQKRQAIAKGDLETYDTLVQEEMQEGVKNTVEQFREKHSAWINGTGDVELEMQAYLLNMDKVLGAKNLPVDQHFDILEKNIRKKYSAYFEESETPQTKVPAVDNVPNSNVAGKQKARNSFTIKDLSPEQKNVAMFLEQQGTMKVNEYIKQLVDAGELE